MREVEMLKRINDQLRNTKIHKPNSSSEEVTFESVNSFNASKGDEEDDFESMAMGGEEEEGPSSPGEVT